MKSSFVQFQPNPNPNKGAIHSKPMNGKARKDYGITTMSKIGNFKGLQLPTNRYNLGLQAINDRFHVLIPREKVRVAQCSERLAHPADTSRSNLAAALSLLSSARVLV